MRLNLNNFDYPFDPSLIAQYPSEKRGQSRLLVLDRQSGEIGHRIFFELSEYLRSGDVLVINNTRVIPARLSGRKERTGGQVELLLLKRLEDNTWEAMHKGRLKEGVRIIFSPACYCEVLGRQGTNIIVRFHYEGDWDSLLSEIGNIPIPPYIGRNPVEEDRQWYQTVYALEDGAIAAPTAGLHFTEEILHSLRSKGVITVNITLHIGSGTFRPVKTAWIEEHEMDPEWCNVDKDVVDIIRTAKTNGARIVAVGTTAVRALEQASAGGEFKEFNGETGLFIYPGFKFNIVDAIITNFHLPKSTLLMLVMAFAGSKNLLKAYKEAVSSRYRFYSYGDAMLIV